MSTVHEPKWPFFLMLGLYWTVWDRYMQVLYLGRALRTKETLPDFLKWRRVTRHPLVYRGLTGSQRTPGKWGVTVYTFISLYLVSNTHAIFHMQFISQSVVSNQLKTNQYAIYHNSFQ